MTRRFNRWVKPDVTPANPYILRGSISLRRAGVTDGPYLDLNGELLVGSHGLVAGQRHQADLVQRVRGVGDQLSEEDLRENKHGG